MKKVAVMIADGTEEIEALTVVDVMRRANIKCDIVSVNGREIKSSHNIEILADKVIDESIKDYDMIVLPGGLPGAYNLAEDKLLIETNTANNNWLEIPIKDVTDSVLDYFDGLVTIKR